MQTYVLACKLVRDCIFYCVDVCLVCLVVSVQHTSPHLSVSQPLIPTSPGRPGSLAEECMGVGSFNKGNTLSGPWGGPGLYFSLFPSTVSPNTGGLKQLLLHFKGNGFTLSPRGNDTGEGSGQELKS